MAQVGVGVITRTAINGPYAYTWKDDNTQEDVDTVVVSRTLAQAYNEIATLAAAMPGSAARVQVTVTTT